MTVVTTTAYSPEDKRIWNQFSDETTMHGFRHINDSTNIIRKIIWLILILLCAAYLVYQTWQKWDDFQKNQISTNIDIDYPSRMHFPAIAICNTNQFRISHMRDSLYHMITDLYQSGKAAVDTHNFTAYEEHMGKLEHEDTFNFLKSAGPSIRDMLLICRWPDGTSCDANDFVMMTTDFGVCYAINTNKHKPVTVNSAGVDSGIYLLLNIESYERMGSPTTTEGLKILIYNQTSLPMISLHGIDLPPGFLNQLGVSMQQKTKLPVSEGGTCVTEDDLDHFDKVEQGYSVEKCKIDKKITMINNICKCIPFYAPLAMNSEPNNTKACSVEEHFSCVVAQTAIPEEASKCRENCTTISFRPFLSMSKLPTTSLEKVVGVKKNSQMLKHYRHSMEARHRVQEDKVLETQELISEMRKMDERLRKLKYRPIKNEFRGIYQNFRDTVPCFNNLLNTYGIAFDEVQNMQRELKEDGAEPADGVILKSLYPNKTNEELYTEWDTLKTDAENVTEEVAGELERILHGLFKVMLLFNEKGYVKELESDITEYMEIFVAIEEFENEDVSKLGWATKTLRIKHMIMSLQMVLEKMLTNVKNLGKINNDEKYLVIKEMLANSTTNDTMMLLVEHYLLGYGLTYDETCQAEIEELQDQQRAQRNQQQPMQGGGQQPTGGTGDQAPPSGTSGQAPPSGTSGQAPPLKRKKREQQPPPNDGGGGGSTDQLPPQIEICPTTPMFDVKQMISESIDCLSGPVSVRVGRMDKDVKQLQKELIVPWEKLIGHLTSYVQLLQWSEKFYEDNILGINIYYQDLSIEKYKQEWAYNKWSFACDLGGTFGLCLGASVISLFEMLDFFILRPFFGAKKKEPIIIQQRLPTPAVSTPAFEEKPSMPKSPSMPKTPSMPDMANPPPHDMRMDSFSNALPPRLY